MTAGTVLPKLVVCVLLLAYLKTLITNSVHTKQAVAQTGVNIRKPSLLCSPWGHPAPHPHHLCCSDSLCNVTFASSTKVEPTSDDSSACCLLVPGAPTSALGPVPGAGGRFPPQAPKTWFCVLWNSWPQLPLVGKSKLLRALDWGRMEKKTLGSTE